MSEEDLEEKILEFQNGIYRQEKERAKDIYEKIEEDRRLNLSKYENLLEQQMDEQIRSEKIKINLEYSRKSSGLIQQRKKDFYSQRNKLVSDVFEATKKTLEEYSKTQEYREFLIQKLENMDKMAGSVIFVKEADMGFADELKQAYGMSCDVRQDDDMNIGGVRVENISEGIFIDESLENILSEQNEWFFIYSGLADL